MPINLIKYISNIFIIIIFLFSIKPCLAQEDYRGTLLTSEDRAVFYIGADNKKYNFLDSKTYLSWFDKFDYVKTVDKNIINSFEFGGMVRYKSGKYEKQIDNLTTGTIVKNINSNGFYYIENGFKRPFLNADSFLTNSFDFDYFVEMDLSNYKNGQIINNKDDSLRHFSKFSIPLIKNYDSDGDGLFDYDEEHFYYTDYDNKDTDGDKISDGDEINKNLSPIDKNIKLLEVDTDNDGLNNFFEIAYKSDLKNPDTDGDGHKDGDEVKNNYDPSSESNKKQEKIIKIDIKTQKLEYYSGEKLLDSFLISSGIRGMDTPLGNFKVLDKIPSKQYGGSGYNFYYPNTKWNLHFTTQKYRFYIHGAYWHNNFGKKMSHGCVNVSYTDMEALYSWADIGTKITIK
ncbi:MAG: L,D-transpeptidase family protein [Patescibacteria group bacterium]|nr:L,D-transpeptidase family protein [Patescibacteria group bacterium]